MHVAAGVKNGNYIVKRVGFGVPFYLTLVYLMLEYGRPQMMIPWIGLMHLPGIVTGLLAVMLIGSGRIDLGNMQTRLILILLALMVVHVPIALNNYWAFHTTREMLITFIAYLSIVTFIDSFEKFQAMITTLIGIHIYLSTIGFLNGGKGVGGFLWDENDFSLVLNMIIPFSFFLAMAAKTISKRLVFLIITAVFSMCIVSTFSRGGFVGLIAVALYCWIKSPRKVLSIILVILLVAAVLSFGSEKYWQEMQTILPEAQDPKGTGLERLYMWKAAWRMFLDYPIIGVGPGNFPWHVESYEPPGGLYDRYHGGRPAHSLYLTLISELGIAGIVIYLLMLNVNWRDRKEITKMTIIKKDLRHKSSCSEELAPQGLTDELRIIHHLALAIGGGLIGFFVSGAFISVLYYPHFLIFLAYTSALKKIANNYADS